MKTKKTVGVSVLVIATVMFTYWLGYEHGSSSTARKPSAVGSSKVFVGETRPYTRNTASWFDAGGDRTTKKTPTEGR
jgi:hypothetical protein